MPRQGTISNKQKHISALAFAVLVTIFMFLISTYNWLPRAPDQFIYDWKVSLLSTRIKEQRKDISLIYIDDKSLTDYFARSPVDRGLLAELIKALDAAKPKVIGLDFIFDRPSEPDRDEALINAFRNVTTPIVMVATNEQERGISGDLLAWQASYLSRANTIRASPFLGTEDTKFSLGDDVIRSMEPFDQTSSVGKPFALALAQYAGVMSYPTSRIIDWLLPSAEGKEPFQIFVVPPHKRVSGTSDGETVLPTFMRAFLKDKLVIIGTNMIGVDRHRVPMTVATNSDVPGAYIQAQILAQIIDHRDIRKLPLVSEIVLVFLTSFFSFWVIMGHYKNDDLPKALSEATILAIIFLGGTLMFWRERIILPSGSLFMVWSLGAFSGKYSGKIAEYLTQRRNRSEG